MTDRSRVGGKKKPDRVMMGFCNQDSETWVVEVYGRVDVLPGWSLGLRKY